MKNMLVSLLLSLMCSSVYASGGGSMGGGGGMQTPASKSPQQIAIQNYDSGIRARDKAWQFEKDAAESKDAKKAARLEKKAMSQFKRAAQRFRAAIKYEPRLYQAYGSLGYALRRLGDYDEALSAYGQALALKPDYTEAIEYRGEAYLGLGRIEDTKKAYVKLMDLDRPRADELMKAIRAWVENPPDGVSDESVTALKKWLGERMQLSRATSDLAGDPKKDWTPD